MKDPEGTWTAARWGMLLAVWLGVTFPGVLTGTQSFFYRDFGVLAYPTVVYAQEAWARGELPLWNPLSHCGVPFLAQWGTMALYPGSLIYLTLPLPWSLNLFGLLHLGLGGVGMYRLARRWVGDGWGAAFAGTAFVWSGLTQACLMWPNYVAALGWAPWVIAAALPRPAGERDPWLGLAVLAALQALTGVPELLALTWWVIGALRLHHAWRLRHGHPRAPFWRTLWRVACPALLAFALSLMLTAVQWLPFLRLLARSQRTGGVDATLWSLPAHGPLNLLAPLLHCFETTQGVFFQHGQELLSSVYLGVGPVALALTGWRLSPVRGRWVLGTLALMGVWLALGPSAGLFAGLREAVPPLGLVRYPVKFVLLTGFAVPWLAALGLTALRPSDPPETEEQTRLARRGFLLGLLVVGLGLGVAAGLAVLRPLPMDQPSATLRNLGMRLGFLLVSGAAIGAMRRWSSGPGRRWAGLALLLVTWADFRLHLPHQNPIVPARLLVAGLGRQAELPSWGEGRVLIAPPLEAALLHSRAPSFETDYVGKRLALWSNLNLLEGIPKVNGASTLRLRESATVVSRLEAPSALAHESLLDFLGVTHVTTAVGEWQPRPSAQPLVTAVEQGVWVAEETLRRELQRTNVDLRTRVYLPLAAAAERGNSRHEASARAQETAEEGEPKGGRAPTGAAPRVEHLEVKTHAVTFSVNSARPAWAVIAQSHDPSWKAWVNGERARVWPANGGFQAVAVPAGGAEVRVEYRDRWLAWGAFISGLAWLWVGVTALRAWRR